jgi:hypothetical protein
MSFRYLVIEFFGYKISFYINSSGSTNVGNSNGGLSLAIANLTNSYAMTVNYRPPAFGNPVNSELRQVLVDNGWNFNLTGTGLTFLTKPYPHTLTFYDNTGKVVRGVNNTKYAKHVNTFGLSGTVRGLP